MKKEPALIVIVIAMIAVSAIVLSGCTSSAPSATPTPVPTPDRNLTIVVMKSGEARSFDPATSDGYDSASAEVIQAVYETLFSFNGSDVLTPVPRLATGYSLSPDGLVYTIYLRPDVRFHDGMPLNAMAVKYSLDRLLLIDNRPAYSNFGATVRGYSKYKALGHSPEDVNAYLSAGGIRALDNQTVQITLESPKPDFITMLTMPATSIISPTFEQYNGGYNVSGRTGSPYMIDHACGTGPFRLDSWQRGQQVTLVKNGDYWGPKARPDKVIIKQVDSYTTRLLAIIRGEADLITVDAVQAPDVVNDPRLVVEAGGDQLAVYTIMMDEAVWPYSDARVRQAIVESFDYDTYLDRCFHGYASRLAGPVPRPLPGHDPGAKLVQFNPAHAKALLQQAGFGTNNTTLTLYYNAENKNRQRAATMLKAQLESYGLSITLDVKEMPWYEYLSNLSQKKLPFFIAGWKPDYPSTERFVRCYLYSDGYYANIVSYQNPAVDALYQQTLTERDPARLDALYRQMATISYYDYPYVYLDQPRQFTVYRKGLQGVVYNPMAGGLGIRYDGIYK